MRPALAPLLALFLIAAPAGAEDAPVVDPAAPAVPGAVALYLQAHELHRLGLAARDPLMVLTAARILQGLQLTGTARLQDPAPAAPVALNAPDAAALLEAARQLDAGQNYADLADMLAREVPPAPRNLRATASTLAPGASEVWNLPFFGGAHGELAILGDGKSNLDLLVTAPGDTQICLDLGNADAGYCGFTLRDNGEVAVRVTNSGTAPDTYLLLTE